MATQFELSFGDPNAGDAREPISGSEIAQRIRALAADPSSLVTRICADLYGFIVAQAADASLFHSR